MTTTTKTLLLARHVQAAWQDAGASERHRPPDRRGEQELARLHRWCAGRLVPPRRIVSSPATQALETARAMAHGFGLPGGAVVVDERLYHGSAHGLTTLLEGLDDAWDCVVLVGHHPELADLCRHFWPGIGYLATGTLAELRFEAGGWRGLLDRRPSLGLLHAPAAGVRAGERSAA
ncbi:MAG: histidine phosphatase family protein [Piscinibacter sp.]|uniref:SixA phosphatase family protein n=1 Tax=Piscinibacter sp. TaxID=1903157 RepID=UPI00258E18D8|nr:histidine phosphatase family protein [Piscinibacter sp.]MCW5666377.1 histidine phosphatase family protein [Piscinibacter sp.]